MCIDCYDSVNSGENAENNSNADASAALAPIGWDSVDTTPENPSTAVVAAATAIDSEPTPEVDGNGAMFSLDGSAVLISADKYRELVSQLAYAEVSRESYAERLTRAEGREYRTEAAMEQLKREIMVAASREGAERDWCGDLDDVLESVGLSRLKRRASATLTFSFLYEDAASGDERDQAIEYLRDAADSDLRGGYYSGLRDFDLSVELADWEDAE